MQALLHINLRAIVANWQLLCGRHGGGAVAAVLKADAYGLGAVEVARALREAGCRHFFVAHLQEALALRAALQPGVKLSVCCYPTGVHNGKLGQDRADTLERLGEIKGAVLTLFGSLDPHVPLDAREQIIEALDRAGVAHKTLLYDADHTFMRDDGYRYDPVASDGALQAITESLGLAFDS